MNGQIVQSLCNGVAEISLGMRMSSEYQQFLYSSLAKATLVGDFTSGINMLGQLGIILLILLL